MFLLAEPVRLALPWRSSSRGGAFNLASSISPLDPRPHQKRSRFSLEIFRRMGIVDEVLARGFMVGAGNFYSNGRTLARIEFRDLDSPYGFIVDLPQNETEEVLLEHLARRGVEVERDTRMLRLEQDDE